MRQLAAAFVFVLAGASPSLAAGTDDMAKIVSGFYGAYSTFHPSDGIPNAAARAKYEPYISPALDALLQKGEAAENKFNKAHKDSPPLLEGDLFTSNFEGATAYKIGACAGDVKAGHCAVMLTYDPGNTGNPKDKPLNWTDTAYLTSTPGGWRVDDIGYGGTWDFGNKGKMTETLHSVIRDSSE